MLSCWELEPDNRPTFSNLVGMLSQMLETMADYLDIGNVNNLVGESHDQGAINSVPESEIHIVKQSQPADIQTASKETRL